MSEETGEIYRWGAIVGRGLHLLRDAACWRRMGEYADDQDYELALHQPPIDWSL